MLFAKRALFTRTLCVKTVIVFESLYTPINSPLSSFASFSYDILFIFLLSSVVPGDSKTAVGVGIHWGASAFSVVPARPTTRAAVYELRAVIHAKQRCDRERGGGREGGRERERDLRDGHGCDDALSSSSKGHGLTRN